MAVETKIPDPPRFDENLSPKALLAAQNRYMWDLHQSFQSGEVLQKTEQSQVQTTNDDTLPDPATATVATAQQTANTATQTANQAAAAVAQTIVGVGQITISGANTTGSGGGFDAGGTDYTVSVTCVATSGAPPTASSIVRAVAKGASSLGITIDTAPGSGKSVTFDFICVRKISGGA